MVKRLWTGDFVKIFITNFINANGFYIILALVPLYVSKNLGLDEFKVGIVMASFSITSVFLRPFAGSILDSGGRIPMYRFSLVFFALCCGGYRFADGFMSLLILRLTHGLAWGLISTSGTTVAADILVKERRAEGLGYYVLAMNVGMALGPGLGVILNDLYGFANAFTVCFIFAFIAVISGWTVKAPAIERKEVKFNMQTMYEPKVAGISFMQICYGFSYGGLMAFAIVYAKSLDVYNSSLFFMIFAVVMSVLRPMSGKYLDKNGPGHLLGAGFIILIAGYVVLSMAVDSHLFFVAAFILGAGSGIVGPILVAMGMNSVPAEKRGVANAMMFSSFDLGIAAGAILLGLAASRFSIPDMYFYSGFTLLVPFCFYYIKEKKYYEKSVR